MSKYLKCAWYQMRVLIPYYILPKFKSYCQYLVLKEVTVLSEQHGNLIRTKHLHGIYRNITVWTEFNV